MFDLKKSKANKKIRLKSFLYFFKILRTISLIVFIVLATYLAHGFIMDTSLEFAKTTLFLVILSFSLFLISYNISLFFNYCITEIEKINPNLEKENVNLANFMTIGAAIRVKKAMKFAKRKHLDVNSSILLYHLLNYKNKKIDFTLNRLLISKKELLSKVKKTMLLTKDTEESTNRLYTLDDIILESAKVAIRRKRFYIKTSDIFSALSKIEPTFKEELRRRKVGKEDIDNLYFWRERLLKKIQDKKKWWNKESLRKCGSVASDWACGFTPTLDKYSVDLTDITQKYGFIEIIGHENEQAQVQRVLIRESQNNVLLVGNNGVGRSSILRSIVQKSCSNQTFPELNGKRFLDFNMSAILTEATTIDQVECILDACFREASFAGNVVLVLNDFDNYINDKNMAGVTDISSLIVPYLRFNEFKFIAVTSYKGLHKYIELKPQVLSLFEKVEVSESSKDETVLLLEREIPFIEYKYKIFVPYLSILKIVELSEKYIHDNSFPQKAIILLNDVAVYLKQIKEKVMLEEHVEKIISEKTEIPIGKLSSTERDVLLNLESFIHERIINQVEAVNEISAALRRARTGMKTKNGPMGTFLFLGPTGVGKTETAKALAEVYFGSETKMIRFDMSEFQTNDDIKRFIGGDNSIGLLATKVGENPFSLVLFDEIEKSHPNILNLLLQILDEGFMTDFLGRRIDFSNTIIIATSNAGYQIILNAIQEDGSMDIIKQDIIDYVIKQSIFRPELINRFDAAIIFKALTKENLLDIADLRFKKLQQNLLKKQIILNVPNKTKMRIVELSYNPQFGAREMRRVIQDKIENVLAKSFLSAEIKDGDVISIDENFKINVLENEYEK